MNLGPAKTNLSTFKGFGFGAKPTGAGGTQAPRPAAARRPSGASKPGGGVSALFAASLDDDGSGQSAGSSSKPSWSKPTVEAMQAQRQAEVLMAQDPSVFQYDEIIDEIKNEREEDSGSQVVRTDVNTQKKRVGLTVPKGAEEVKTGTKRQAKYIEKVLVATDRRKVEQQIIEDRLLKKEKDARKDCEVFVTEAFKEELKKRQKFVDELEAQEVRDNLKAAEKQEHGRGFADMYRNLLNGGLATSRGGEKVKERAAPRSELPKEELKEEAKEESEESVKDEARLKSDNSKDSKDEDEQGEAAGSSFGVQDVTAAVEAEPGSKKAKLAEEQEQRVEKAMSARERFLARKKAAASGAAADE